MGLSEGLKLGAGVTGFLEGLSDVGMAEGVLLGVREGVLEGTPEGLVVG